MPLRALDAAVVVRVEIFEAVLAIDVDVAAEEFLARQRVVAVAIDPDEVFAAVEPFGAGDPSVIIAIEIGEATLGPVPEFRPGLIVVIAFFAKLARGANPHFVAGQHAVAVPVVTLERLIAAAPFRPRDRAVAVGIHGLKADLGRPAVLCPLPLRARKERDGQSD